jgi:hypothetical protein
LLSLTRNEKVEVARVLAYANKNKVTLDKVQKMFAGELPPVGDSKGHTCELRAGKRKYRIAFSYEEQPIGWVRHISVSCDKSMSTMDMNGILRTFGYRWRELKDMTTETTAHKSIKTWWEGDEAFNVIEVMDDEKAQDPEIEMASIEKVSRSVAVINPPQTVQN